MERDTQIARDEAFARLLLLVDELQQRQQQAVYNNDDDEQPFVVVTSRKRKATALPLAAAAAATTVAEAKDKGENAAVAPTAVASTRFRARPRVVVTTKPVPSLVAKVHRRRRIKSDEDIWRDEMLATFRNFDGRFTAAQYSVLHDRGFQFENGGKHTLVKYGSRCCSVSMSPSDSNAGRQAARQFLRMMDRSTGEQQQQEEEEAT